MPSPHPFTFYTFNSRRYITEESVNEAMAAVSDADLVAGLGWDAAAAADGGFASADVPAAGMEVLYRPFAPHTVMCADCPCFSHPPPPMSDCINDAV